MIQNLFLNPPKGSLIEICDGSVFNKVYVPADDDSIDAYTYKAFQGAPDMYFAPALRKRRGSEKEDVLASRVLWVDIDDRKQVPDATFPPTYAIRSGGGFHLYWVLNDWCYDITVLEELNRFLADDVKGDHCWNANRVLRMPGSLNTKRNANVLMAEQVAENVYDLADFTVLSKVDSKTRHKIRTGDYRGLKSRSERDWRIIEALVIAGASDEQIQMIFTRCYCGDKFRQAGGQEYLKHTIEQVREKSVTVKTIRRAYGDIIEGDDGYYIEKARGRFRLSTFTMRPTLLLEGEAEDVLVCDVRANGYSWDNIQFPRSAFNDRKSLDKHLKVTAWTWLGRDDDVRGLLPFLLKQLQDLGLPKTKATTTLGRKGDLYVGTYQTLAANKVFNGVDAPLTFLLNGREMPKVRYAEGDLPDLHEIGMINRPEVVWPVLGWFMATPYKSVLAELGLRFPVLNIYGTKGSGKTSMIGVFQRMLGFENPTSYDCNTTRFVMLVLLGATSTVPISLSEYRIQVAERVNRFILLSYDTGHDPRGRSNQTTIDYPLTAPFSVDGEDMVTDAACRERIVAVGGFSPDTIAEDTKCYSAFKAIKTQSLNSFALPYIQYTLYADVSALFKQAEEDVRTAFPQVLPDRVRHNLIISRMGQLSFCNFYGHAIPDAEVLSESLGAVWSSRLGRASSLVDDFAETIVNNAKFGTFFFKRLDGVLWFQLATAFQWWLKHRRMTNQTSLDREAIRTQLAERLQLYVVEPKVVEGVWCYGIDLKRAVNCGLDVPSAFLQKSVTLELEQ